MRNLVKGGKWQRRVLQTLHEAQTPLTTQQLIIRVGYVEGVGHPHNGTLSTTLRGLRKRGLVTKVRWNLWTVPAAPQEAP